MRIAKASLFTLLPLAGCFTPSTDGDDEIGDTGTETDTSDATTTGDGDGDPTETGQNLPPSVDTVTVNGLAAPAPVTAAGKLIVVATGSDPELAFDRIDLDLDGVLVGTLDGSGLDEYSWIVSGAELNGDSMLTVTAYDLEGAASEPTALTLTLDMPDGGTTVDAWTFDGGLLDAAYGIAATPTGDEVVVTGQTVTNNGSQQRNDRVVGPAWADTIEDFSTGGTGIVAIDSGWLVSGSALVGQEFDSVIYSYDSTGTKVDTWTIDASKPEMGNPPLNDGAVGFGQDGTDALRLVGTYQPAAGPYMGQNVSYLAALTSSGDQDWVRWPTEDPAVVGQPILAGISVGSDGSLAVVGRDIDGQFWVGRWAENGDHLGETVITDYPLGRGFGVHLADDGELIVAGSVEEGGVMSSWVGRLDADDQLMWSDVPTQTGAGATAAVGVDPFGEIVTVSTEDCTAAMNGLTDCALVVRKYDDAGVMMWSRVWADETFSGPVFNLVGLDASLAFDDYGYVYVTAVVYNPNTGTDWWASKLNP